MQELVVQHWCDFCYKESRIKAKSVNTHVVKIDGAKPRLIEMCDDHDSMVSALLESIIACGTVEQDGTAPPRSRKTPKKAAAPVEVAKKDVILARVINAIARTFQVEPTPEFMANISYDDFYGMKNIGLACAIKLNQHLAQFGLHNDNIEEPEDQRSGPAIR